MKEYFKLAWRSLWRNKRRTLITAASIFFAVIIAILMRSFQLGSYSHMIHNVVETYTGYIQVQHEDYWNKKTINNTFVYSDSLAEKILNTENVKDVYPRLESFALASSGNATKGAFVMGVVPEKENEMAAAAEKIVKYQLNDSLVNVIISNENVSGELADKLKKLSGQSFTSRNDLALDLFGEENPDEELLSYITDHTAIEGAYINADENAVLVAEKLAKFLNITTGDTLILISQGVHGISASGLYPVKGIIKLPNPELNRAFIYMPLSTAQQFYSADNRLTSLALNVHNQDDRQVLQTKMALKEKLDAETYAVMDWKEMNPELVQQIQSDNASGIIMLVVLYVIIAFGIFSTVLMMTAERRREFGVMIAIGMKKLKLTTVVIIEMVFIGLLGTFTGMIMSIPFVLLGYYNPIRLSGEMAQSMESFGMEAIMPMAMIDTYYLNQALVILAIILVTIIYPIVNIHRLKEIDALRA